MPVARPARPSSPAMLRSSKPCSTENPRAVRLESRSSPCQHQAMTLGNAARSRGDEIVQQLLTQPYPRDPYPLYHELRAIGPVFPSAAGPWILTSYEACALTFRSPAFGQGEAAELVRQDPRYEWSAVLQSLGQMMVFMDPPDHTRLRRIVSRVFSPRTIEQLRPYVQQVVDDLLTPLGGTAADLVTEFSDLIPVTVICELLG